MPEIVYRIRAWDEHFENNKSREIESCRYVCMPNKQDGLGLMRILSEKDGAAIFGIWCLMLQACSRQKVRDGWLTEDGTAVGVPWDAEDLAIRWRRTPDEIRRTLDVVSNPKVGWVKKIERNADEVPAPGTGRIAKSQREGKKEEREAATAPEKERPALSLLESLFLSTHQRAAKEWQVLSTVDAGAVGSEEILNFIHWAVTTARKRGKTVEYAKHCLPEAAEWKADRGRRGYTKPKDAA